MFQFTPEQLAVIRRKKIGDAFIVTFDSALVRARWSEDKTYIVASDPLDNHTRFGFDGYGFISTIVSAKDRVWQITNDPDGRAATLTNPAGHTLGMTYGPTGQLQTIYSNNRRRLDVLYDQRQTQAGASFPDGTQSYVQYTVWNAPGAVTNRLEGRELYEYDEHRRLIALTDQKGAQTQFQYGRWSRPDATIHPNEDRETYAYNDKGFVSQIASGTAVVDIETDDNGHPLSLEYSDGIEIQYKYDDKGRTTESLIETQTNDLAETHLCKAVWKDDRLTEEQNGDAHIRYNYDDAGRLIGMICPTGETIAYEWDADSRLTSVRDWDGGEHRFRYFDNDRGYILTAPNGLDTYVVLNDIGRPKAITVAERDSAFFSLSYEYDEEDRISVLNDNLFGPRSFQYDPEGQLRSTYAHNVGQQESFTYDPAGNPVQISEKTAGFNDANQMITHGRSSYIYDERGNLISMNTATGFWHFTYNARNLMVSAESPEGSVTHYAYDAFSRRIRKTTLETIVHFVWAGEQLIAQITETAGTTVRQDFLYYPGTYTPLATRIGGKIYSYHTDHLGAPRMLTGPNGSTVWTADYASFGKALVAGSVPNPLRAPGQYFDEETGLHYNRFRYYSPGMGRYLSRDPAGFLAGLNLYCYAANDPINQADPLGLWSWKTVATVVATVAVATVVAVVLAPVLGPAAILVAGAAAGAVAGGLNQALNEKAFCLPCILKAAGLGALVGAVASVPFLFLGPAAGIPAFMGAGSASGLIGYVGNYVDGANPTWSWKDCGESMAIGGLTAGVLRSLAGPPRAGVVAEESPFARGRASESRVLQDLGLEKNTSKVSSPEGDAIPDALTDTMSVEIKDTQSVSLTRQLRIQTDAANGSGRQSVLITGTDTEVSGPADDAFDLIIRRDDLGPQ